MRRGMVFYEGVTYFSFTWSKIHMKLDLTCTAPNPMITHVCHYGLALINYIIDKSLNGCAVNLNNNWVLGMPHFIKGYSNGSGLLSINVACTDFRICRQTCH